VFTVVEKYGIEEADRRTLLFFLLQEVEQEEVQIKLVV